MSAFHAILEARGLFGSVGAKGFVFTTTGHSPVGGYSRAKERIDVVMERLGAGKKQGNKIPPWRFHDLRRTMATGMARLKIPLPVIEKILAHSSGTFAGIVGVIEQAASSCLQTKQREIVPAHHASSNSFRCTTVFGIHLDVVIT